MKRKEFESIKMESVVMNSEWGSCINNALGDAISFAIKKDCQVQLNFNDRTYYIDPKAIRNNLKVEITEFEKEDEEKIVFISVKSCDTELVNKNKEEPYFSEENDIKREILFEKGIEEERRKRKVKE